MAGTPLAASEPSHGLCAVPRDPPTSPRCHLSALRWMPVSFPVDTLSLSCHVAVLFQALGSGRSCRDGWFPSCPQGHAGRCRVPW